MESSGPQPSGSARGHTARFGLWRAIAATPAVIGSLLLLTLASGALGRWAGLLLLAWAAGAALLMTRIGERITVRAACRFRSPSPVQVVALHRPWVAALRMTGTAAGDVELYVQTARVSNAYAAGDAASRSPAGSWRTTRPVDCRRTSWWPCWYTSWAITPRERLGRCCSCRSSLCRGGWRRACWLVWRASWPAVNPGAAWPSSWLPQ